jgi:hypothetical protein
MREHVIADQNINYVQRFIYAVGYTAERVASDYGYDLMMTTYDEFGYIEPGEIYFQLKATDTIKESPTGSHVLFSLTIADYNLYSNETSPVFLVMYDAPARCGYWLYIQQYFEEDPARRPKKGADSIRVRIPIKNRVDRRWILYTRGRKFAVRKQLAGVVHHD